MAEGVTVLLADDDRSIRIVVTEALEAAGFTVEAAGDIAGLWQMVTTGKGDVAIADVLMPDGNGLDLLPRIAETRPDLPVIVMSAQNTLVTAVKATERGAFDYLPKPFDLDDLERAVRQAAEQARRSPAEPKPAAIQEVGLVGRSPAMQTLYRAMARLMATDLTVIISGESGTGKELVARALHSMGKRRDGPFVAVNMAAIPPELIESELFGHEKGAFTGATARRAGRFEQARRGTLFLDEIGDMPIEAQTRLLRVLQDGAFTRVGGAEPIAADSRIIAATNQPLPGLVRAGRFRQDLYYRLNVVPLEVPPLRDRVDDIEALAGHFVAKAAAQGLPAKRIAPDALATLKAYDWPGNVRELENLIHRLCALTAEDVITEARMHEALAALRATPEDGGREDNLHEAVRRHLARYFAAHGQSLPPAGLHARVVREVERPLFELALDATRGNQLKAAEILGMNRNTLRKKMRELDLTLPRPRRSAPP